MSKDLVEKEESHIGAWILMGLALLYTFSPIDILPDVIPIFGWLVCLVLCFFIKTSFNGDTTEIFVSLHPNTLIEK